MSIIEIPAGQSQSWQSQKEGRKIWKSIMLKQWMLTMLYESERNAACNWFSSGGWCSCTEAWEMLHAWDLPIPNMRASSKNTLFGYSIKPLTIAFCCLRRSFWWQGHRLCSYKDFVVAVQAWWKESLKMTLSVQGEILPKFLGNLVNAALYLLFPGKPIGKHRAER